MAYFNLSYDTLVCRNTMVKKYRLRIFLLNYLLHTNTNCLTKSHN